MQLIKTKLEKKKKKEKEKKRTYLGTKNVDGAGDKPLEHPPGRKVVIIRRHILRYEPVLDEEPHYPHGSPHLLLIALRYQRIYPHEALLGLLKR